MTNVERLALLLMALALIATARSASAQAPASAGSQLVRVKDLAQIRGVRSNYLTGMGLVVGLKATGDSARSLATNKAVASMLTRLGMKTKAEEVAPGNMAAVLVTADLPAFSRNGTRLDVKVSAIGDAKSLAGGTLVMTPLRAGDQEVYALAQGAVVVGQASNAGPQVLTVARVPLGGTVEREFTPALGQRGLITLSLANPDFTTASRMAEAINAKLKGFFASAKDHASVDVMVPQPFQSRLVDFVADLEGVEVNADVKAFVVLNERTGTVVMGSSVVINPVSIVHGELSIQVGGDKGKKGAKAKSVVSMKGATVGDLVETMNAMGVKPPDLVGILQAIHAAGALRAEIKFM